jgi:NADP-dependent 3-hydroxy acid dehydrogenase YdfG
LFSSHALCFTTNDERGGLWLGGEEIRSEITLSIHAGLGDTMSSNKTIRIFDGATAIVTGGASGIGRALAVGLAKRGCEVILADLQIELAEEVASEINASGGKAKAAKKDVTDFPAMEQLVKGTVQRTGRLDYIFNNAGIVIGGSANLYSIEDWNQVKRGKGDGSN